MVRSDIGQLLSSESGVGHSKPKLDLTVCHPYLKIIDYNLTDFLRENRLPKVLDCN